MVTPEDAHRLVADFNARMDPTRPLLACASCGVRDPARPQPAPMTLHDLPDGHWLRYSEDEITELLAMPEVDLLTLEGHTRRVQLRDLRSCYKANDREYFHVHPELVEADAETGHLTVHLCESCGSEVLFTACQLSQSQFCSPAGWGKTLCAASTGRTSRIRQLQTTV